MTESKKELNIRYRFLEDENEKAEREAWVQVFNVLGLFVNEKIKNEDGYENRNRKSEIQGQNTGR